MSQDFWTLTGNPPANTDKVASLASWSTNYDARTGTPFGLFLDLIGYSTAEFGENLVAEPHRVVGYLEASLLADALKQYSDFPADVYKFCERLVSAEQ